MSGARYGALARLCGAGILLAFVAGACATPVGIRRVSPRDVHRSLTRNVLTDGTPSAASAHFLSRLSLAERFASEPAVVLEELRAGLGGADERDRLFALAELSFAHAVARRERAHALAAVVYAYAFLFPADSALVPPPYDPRLRLALDLYNLGLAAGLAAGDDPRRVELHARTLALPFGVLDLDADPGGFRYAGHDLGEFVSITDLEIRGVRNRYRQPEIGAVRGDGPEAEGNDGVVAYTSAHVDGVVSELVVRSGHSAQSHPATIEEVRRILYLHGEEAGVPALPDPAAARVADPARLALEPSPR